MLFVSFIEDFNGKEEILKACSVFYQRKGTQKAYKTKDNNSYLFEANLLLTFLSFLFLKTKDTQYAFCVPYLRF